MGILCADPEGDLSTAVIQQLFLEARAPVNADSTAQGTSLPQVHAMNCLKDMFTNTKLGSCSESQVGPGLELVAIALGSEMWVSRILSAFRCISNSLLQMGNSKLRAHAVQIPHRPSAWD